VGYNLNPRLVRGLDYYTRTAFEIFSVSVEKDDDKRIALGGGGRYDSLMEILGGRPTPAIGMAVGVERVISLMKDNNIEVADSAAADVFIAQLGEEAKKKSMRLFEEMRAQGIRVRESFAKNGLKVQMEIANKLGVKYTLILGQKEILDGTIIMRDMDSGIQEIVVFEKIMGEIQRRLAGGSGVKTYQNNEETSSGDKKEEYRKDEQLIDKKGVELEREADELLQNYSDLALGEDGE